MINALSTPRSRIWTFVTWVICALLAISAKAIGIDDNPPGILLAFLATIAFVLSFVHPWRTSRQFRRLLYASILGLIVFGGLFILLDITISNLEDSGLVYDLLQGVAAILLVVVLICPASLLVGAIGAVIMFIRNRQQPTSGSKTAS